MVNDEGNILTINFGNNLNIWKRRLEKWDLSFFNDHFRESGAFLFWQRESWYTRMNTLIDPTIISLFF